MIQLPNRQTEFKQSAKNKCRKNNDIIDKLLLSVKVQCSNQSGCGIAT